MKKEVKKCPVCGTNGATDPISEKEEDIGYCWKHFPSGWTPGGIKEQSMKKEDKKLISLHISKHNGVILGYNIEDKHFNSHLEIKLTKKEILKIAKKLEDKHLIAYNYNLKDFMKKKN